MKPRLFRGDSTEFSSLGIGVLAQTISCVVTEQLGVAPTLEMSLINSDPLFADVTVGNIIACIPNKNTPSQAFIIEEITKPIDGIVTIYATHIAQHRAKLIPVAPFSASNLDEALTKMVSESMEDNPFTLVRDPGKNNVTATMHPTVPHSFRELMGGVAGSVLDTYRGEWGYDNFTITLYNKRGRDNGARVMYGRNMSDFNLEEQFNWNSSATGVIGYWVSQEAGTTVIGDIQYSENADLYPYNKTVCMDFSEKFETAPSKTDLNTYALSWINGKGLIGASVDVAYQQVNVEGGADVGIGDVVHIYNGTYNFEMESRIVGLEFDVLSEEYTNVSIGDMKTTLNEAISDIGGGSTTVGGGGASVEPSTSTPLMDGTASVGTEQTYARGDHVHPTDTSRAAKTDLTINNINPSDKWVIPDNTDFNDIHKIGTWYVPNNVSLATMSNTPPTTDAGTLTVSTPLRNNNIGVEISGAWQYVLQEYNTFSGETYRRRVSTNASGTWEYAAWEQDYPIKPSSAQSYSTDFNNITRPGLYSMSGTAMTNAPPSYTWSFLEVKKTPLNGGIVQEVYNATHRYQRMYTGNPLTWTAWYPIQFADQTVIKGSCTIIHQITTDVSTTGTTLDTGAVLGQNTFVKQYSGTKVLLLMGGAFYCDRYTGQIDAVIDGAQATFIRTNSNTRGYTNSTAVILTNISAGSHTVKFVLRAQSGATAYAPAWHLQYLTLLEI